MNESHVTHTALPEATPARSEAVPGAAGWTAGHITAIVIGTLLVLISLVLLGAGGTGLWADRTQRDGGYVTTDVHDFSTSGAALATVSTELGSAGVGWLYAPGLLDEVRYASRRRARARPCLSGSALPRPSTATSRA